MSIEPQRKINEQELRSLGFSEAAIKEAQSREQKGLLNVEPSKDLKERVIESCNAILAEQKHKKRMETDFMYRTMNNFLNYIKSWYR